MNRRLIGANVLNHPIIKRLLESRMFTTSEVIRVIAEELSAEEVSAFIDAAKADPKKGATKMYRTLSKKYHPDRNKDNPEAEAAFKQTMNLRDILSGKKPDMIKDDLTVKALKAAGYSDQQIQSFQGSGKIDLQAEPGKETGDKPAAGGKDIEASKEEVISAKKFQEQLKSVYDAFEAVLKKYANNAEGLYSIEAVKELVPVLKENMLTEQDEDVEKLITDDATESIKRIAKALNDLKAQINKEVQQIVSAVQKEPETAVAPVSEQQVDPEGEDNIEALDDWTTANEKFYTGARNFVGGKFDKEIEAGYYQIDKPKKAVIMKEGDKKEWFRGKKAGVEKELKAGNLNRAAFLVLGEINKWEKEIDKVGQALQKAGFRNPKSKEVVAYKHQLQVWIDLYKMAEGIIERYSKGGEKKPPAPLTPEEKSFPLAVLMKGELTTQEHGQLVKTTKIYGDLYKKIQRWVKIYGLLARFINSGTKKLTGQEDPPQQKLIAQVQQLQLPQLPDPPPPEPDPEPEPTPEPEPEPEPEIEDEEEEEEEGIFIPVQEFNKLFDALEPSYELFENRFLKTPFLGKAAKIFTGLYDALIQFDKSAQQAGQANLTTADVGAEQSSATAQQAAAKRDDLYEQDTGLGENIRPQLMEILKELRPLVTEVVDAIDRYFETVKTGPQGEDDERSTTIGGGVIEEKITDLMNSIQTNLGELNELLSRLSAGKGDFYSLKEQEEEAAAPESFTDKGKGKRARRNKVPRAERIQMVRAVYKQVVSNLVEFVTAVEGLGDIDSVDYTKQMRPLIENSIDELNTIRNFFPSMAPFGKAKDAKEKREVRRQAKNLGRKLNDIVDRLNRMVRQKDVDRKQRQQSRGGVPQQGDQATPGQRVDNLQEQQNFDKGTLKELDELTLSASKMIQDAFGADSKIGKVVAQKREIKDTDAAPTPAGDKAIKAGQATTPEDPAAVDDESKAAFNEVDSPQEALTAFRDLKSIIKSRMGVIKNLAPNPAWKNDEIYTYIFYVFLKNDFESVVKEQEENISGLSGTTMDQLGLTVDKVKFLKNVIKARALKKDDKGNPSNPDLYFFYTGVAKIISDPKKRRVFMEKVIEPLNDRIKKQQRKFNLNASDLRVFIMKAVEMRDSAERDPTVGTANENLEIKITNKLKPIIERMLHG